MPIEIYKEPSKKNITEKDVLAEDSTAYYQDLEFQKQKIHLA